MKIVLPMFVRKETHLLWGLLLFTSTTMLYLGSNHFHVVALQLLPMFSTERAIPFIPTTVWIYVSEYVYLVLLYAMCRDLDNVNKFVYAFLFTQIVSNLIFCFWPTAFPRSMFPLPDHLNVLTTRAFTLLRRTDTAANCCPSLHVSNVYLSSF